MKFKLTIDLEDLGNTPALDVARILRKLAGTLDGVHSEHYGKFEEGYRETVKDFYSNDVGIAEVLP